MKLSKVTSLLAGTLLMTACSTMTTNSESIMTISNKEKAVALLNSIETGDQKAISYVNPEQYTQHNLAIADGLAGFGAVLQALPKNSAKVNVVRSFSDGEYVFTHTDYNFFGPKVGFDLFRFEDGLIVEHWDNLDEKSATANPSGRTQIDGHTQVTDLDKTEENKALVASFVDAILVKGEFDKLSSFFDGDNYLQHNTAIADGLSGLGQALEAMAKNGIKMVYTTNHKVLGEGNFVLSISEGSFADKPTSFYDLFRVENGKIVEHWDIMETIIPKEQWKNVNGKFGNL
jgi:predicted SnoaL-like aldol condensation-catalyzing enzyme